MYSTISSVNHELIIPGGLTEDSVDVMRLVLLFKNPFSLLLIQNKKTHINNFFKKGRRYETSFICAYPVVSNGVPNMA